MSCPACGGRTTRRGRCRECEQIERLEEEFSASRSDRSDRYECPECGLAESDAPDRQCWVCRSERHTRDADGHVVEADVEEHSATTDSEATTDTMFENKNTTETETNSDDQLRTDGGVTHRLRANTVEPETLQLLREQAGLSQSDLADRAGLSRSSIWACEDGREWVTDDVRESILEALRGLVSTTTVAGRVGGQPVATDGGVSPFPATGIVVPQGTGYDATFDCSTEHMTDTPDGDYLHAAAAAAANEYGVGTPVRVRFGGSETCNWFELLGPGIDETGPRGSRDRHSRPDREFQALEQAEDTDPGQICDQYASVERGWNSRVVRVPRQELSGIADWMEAGFASDLTLATDGHTLVVSESITWSEGVGRVDPRDDWYSPGRCYVCEEIVLDPRSRWAATEVSAHGLREALGKTDRDTGWIWVGIDRSTRRRPLSLGSSVSTGREPSECIHCDPVALAPVLPDNTSEQDDRWRPTVGEDRFTFPLRACERGGDRTAWGHEALKEAFRSLSRLEDRLSDDIDRGEGIETDGGDDIEECCLVEADRLYPPCMSESPEGLSCNRPKGHEGPHWCCSVSDDAHPKTEWEADETGRGQIEADGGSQEQKPSPIWTHWISPDEPVRLVTIARVVQVGDGAAAERSGGDVVLWPGRHPETRIWETADERDDPQPTVIRATCHVSLGTVMPASGAVDHYRALARSSASEVGWPAGAGFDQEESGESEVATDGGQVEVGDEGVVTATAPDDTDCVTYGPVSVADGDWIDTWMLTVTTESGCVEVELPRGAMYSLWREVRGVPWPEAQTENRERHRFVQELVRRGNDASLQLLSDAVQVLRGDLVAVDPQEVRR